MGRPDLRRRVPAPVEALARVRVPKHFNHRSPAGAPRPGRRAAPASTSTVRRGPPGRRPRGRGEDARARPAARRRCAGTRATLPGPGGARPLGRAALAGCSATPRRCAARWPTAPARSPARSTGSARCSTDRGYLVRRRRRSPTPAGCWPGSGPRPTCSSPSACAAACGTGSARPSWPPPSSVAGLRGPPGGRRARLGPARRGRRRGRRDLQLWAELRGGRGRARAAADPGAGPRLRLADLPMGPGRDAGQGARPACTASTATCRPATSCAGPARCSTCSARSPTRRAPTDGVRGTARQAMDAMNRGVLAYTRWPEARSRDQAILATAVSRLRETCSCRWTRQ